jgi:hypothetical protein
VASHIEALRAYLESKTAGALEPTNDLVRLMQNAWSHLRGSDDQATDYRKLDRMEQIVWKPPQLFFVLERHGRTVNQSSRADLHQWTVDIDLETASCNPNWSYRQLYPSAPRLNVNPLVAEAVRLVDEQVEHEWIVWENPDRFYLRIGQIIPEDAPQLTVHNRRKRFRTLLQPLLEERGWQPVPRTRPNTYSRPLVKGDK